MNKVEERDIFILEWTNYNECFLLALYSSNPWFRTAFWWWKNSSHQNGL